MIENDEKMNKLSNHYDDDGDESEKHIQAREVDSRA